MSEKPISPLRQRMIDDMTARRIMRRCRKQLAARRTFAPSWPHHRTPPRARPSPLSRHLAQLPDRHCTINAAVAALRFFFNATLERPDLVRPLTTVNTPRREPVVLSQEEVARLLENPRPASKYKAALSVAYGAGLQVSEGRGAEGVRPRQPAHDASGRARARGSGTAL